MWRKMKRDSEDEGRKETGRVARERWNQYRYADIEIFFSRHSCNGGLWNIWPKYQVQDWNKFCVLWNKRNISRTQLAERTIAVYYSPTYRSAFVLSYKVRSSVSFSITFGWVSIRIVRILPCALRISWGIQDAGYTTTAWPKHILVPPCQYDFLIRIYTYICACSMFFYFYSMIHAS